MRILRTRPWQSLSAPGRAVVKASWTSSRMSSWTFCLTKAFSTFPKSASTFILVTSPAFNTPATAVMKPPLLQPTGRSTYATRRTIPSVPGQVGWIPARIPLERVALARSRVAGEHEQRPEVRNAAVHRHVEPFDGRGRGLEAVVPHEKVFHDELALTRRLGCAFRAAGRPFVLDCVTHRPSSTSWLP